MEYVSGDPVLIKNIVTQLKSQGIFDQFRKECIADVDTKPAYQNLCHRADTQVSKFLSKVKWGPDLHKNQTRENIRRQVNECNFVEPGIAIIVDQLVNPRINTVLVPKVEDMLYKYLGIPRPEVNNTTSQKETNSSMDRNPMKDELDSGAPGVSGVEINDKKKDTKKQHTNGSEERSRLENQRNDGINSFKNDSSSNKVQVTDDKSSIIKTESFDSNAKNTSKPTATRFEEDYSRLDLKTTPISDFESESSDDEMSPPFEPNVKSDNDMSIGSGDSNFSEIIDTRPPNEPEIPGVDDNIVIPHEIEDSKIITEHEDSMDSVRTSSSTPPAPVEKVHISPLEIPKTPTINYETSDESDDYIKNKKLLDTVAVESVEPLEVPEVNFDKFVEKVIEDTSVPKVSEMAEMKPQQKDDDKGRDNIRLDEAKKKSKYKDDKVITKPAESKEKLPDKKPEHRSSEKDRKYDKHRSEHKSKDREKEKPKQDSSKSHSKKDDKSHHSRDHSKSDHDRKSKSDYKKDDHKKDDKSDHKKESGKSEHKKDDRNDHKKSDRSEHRKDSRSDRDKKEIEKKHSKDDKDRKKDSHKVSTSDDKKSSKPIKPADESKHKYDKPKDDKKSSKNGDHHKSKKKEEDPKKSRTHCNIDEKRKTDRRSSDRDSSGPSTSNSSSVHHSSSQYSSKSDKDKGSSKHRHSSSSSSSHKTKRNDSEHEKNHSDKSSHNQEKNSAVEDDLEMILESSPDKGFRNDIKSDVNFTTGNLFSDKAKDQSNDHIEDMMNEMFQPTKPVLKKPKIAKNFADIRRIMELRKLYEEDVKLKVHEQIANESTPEADKSTLYKIKLRKTVDYFVTKRFGKNGNNLDKCKELTNAIIDTLTDVKLNITRIDRRYSLVDGSCTLNDEENGLISTSNNNINDGKSTCTKICYNDEIENLPIIDDERANLILEDLANSYTDPNFKLGNIPDEYKNDQKPFMKLPLTEDETIKIVPSEIKANGAKKRLPKKLSPSENHDKSKELVSESMTTKEEDSNATLKIKFKSISDGKGTTWQACDQLEQIKDPVRYFPMPNYNSDFMQFANELLNEEYNFEMENVSVEMDYPECYDFMFVNFLGAKVTRKKSDDPKTSPIKYNSEIINKKLGDKSIMLRIKKSSESEEFNDQKILNKKRKIADDSGVELDHPESCKEDGEPIKKKKKTLGIKRSVVNPFKMKLTSGQLDDTVGNNLTANTSVVKNKNTPLSKKITKVNKSKEMAIDNANHKRSESESSDGRRSSVSSTGTSTHSKGTNESPTPVALTQNKNKSNKNISLNDSKTDTIENNTNEGAATTKTADPPPVKKANDTRNAEEKRKQSIMNCYYDESDLYKPRPSLRLTSRRYRLGNTENT